MLIPAADSQTKSGRLWFHNRSFVLVAMSLSTLLAVPATLWHLQKADSESGGRFTAKLRRRDRGDVEARFAESMQTMWPQQALDDSDIPSTADIAKQLDAMEKEQRQALRRLTTSEMPAGTSKSASSDKSTQRPLEPAERSRGGCAWQEHPGKYLGELLNSGDTERSLPEAQDACAAAGDSCAGVTCSSLQRCSARRGFPYLAPTPPNAPPEVSYTKACSATKPREVSTSWVMQPPRSPVSREPLRPDELVIVVIAHNRPDCLERCLAALAQLDEIQNFRIAVSLDDPSSFGNMEAAVRRAAPNLKVDVWRKSKLAGDRAPLQSKTAVSKISEHFRFALAESFERQQFEFAIFLENDLLVSPDFLWLFRAAAWLLLEDPSLFCVSAWNDNGFPGLVSNESKLFRTDYFPGLGWMIHKSTWLGLLKEEWPRFPSTGWDHWLRHGSGLYPRECIVPEISRTHHFDTRGTNVKAGTPLAKKLNGMPSSRLQPKSLGDLEYLLQDSYEAEIRQSLHQAEVIGPDRLTALNPHKAYVLPYFRRDYKKLAQKLQLTEAQPRAAHRGVICTRDPSSGARVYLADRMKSQGLLPDAERAEPHLLRRIEKAQPGESCANLCARIGMHCADLELEFINNCAALKRFFPCEEGCGHQVGQEIPCYVHDISKDTGKQCLVTVSLKILHTFVSLNGLSFFRAAVALPNPLVRRARDLYREHFAEVTVLDLSDNSVRKREVIESLKANSSLVLLCPYGHIMKLGLAMLESKIKQPLDIMTFANAHVMRAGGFHALAAQEDLVPARRRVFLSSRHMFGLAPGALLAPGQEPGFPEEAPPSKFGPEVYRLTHEDAERLRLTVPIGLQIIRSTNATDVAQELADLHFQLGIKSIHIVPDQPRLSAALAHLLEAHTNGGCTVTTGADQPEASIDAILVAGSSPNYVHLAQEFPRLARWRSGKSRGSIIVAGAAKNHASAVWMAFAIEDQRAEEALQRTSVEFGRKDRRLKWDELPFELRSLVNEGNARKQAEIAIARGVETLGDPWDMWLGRLLVYRDRHKRVNVRFLATQFGHELGAWMQKQRQQWESGALKDHKVARLKGLGVMLDPDSETFAQGLSELRMYVAQHRKRTVPAFHITGSGFQLGAWVLEQRTKQRRGKLSLQRQQLLKEAFFLWQPAEAPASMFMHPEDPEAAEVTHAIEAELRSLRWQPISQRRTIFRSFVLRHHPDISDSQYANDAIRMMRSLSVRPAMPPRRDSALVYLFENMWNMICARSGVRTTARGGTGPAGL
eukprot:s961_g5.t3